MNKKDSSPLEPEDAFQSHHLTERTTDEPLIRVMALHALAYCERLFYIEEVEEIRVADANVYAGRRIHDELDKGPDVFSLELASERLAIRGKADCVRRQSGELIVYEHKKGRSKNGCEAWPSDRLQVLAYSLLLAEQTGESISEAKIRYHADNKTIKIPILKEDAEQEIFSAVARAKMLRNSINRPPVSVPERQCRTCSLAPVCLPEEDRFALHDKKDQPQRLFPADDDRQIIHVVEQGCSIRKDGEQLIVYFPDKTKKALPSKMISSLVLHGNIQISTQVIHYCAANDIGVHWLSYGGNYVGGLVPGAGGVQRRNRQYQAFQDHLFKSRLVLKVAMAKVENQFKYILRATRPRKEGLKRSEDISKKIDGIRLEIKGMGKIQRNLEVLSKNGMDTNTRELIERSIGSVRGHEGMAGKHYFSVLPEILNIERDSFLYFEGRNRHPPKDPFNALLSFGYALLYRDCVASLIAVGLDPSFGFYHTPRSAAYPLALDLMELFRCILWDIPLIGSVNRKQWGLDDFQASTGQVWLNTNGRRKAIQLYEARKREKWKHPVLKYALSYARSIELEARLLEKEWLEGQGLFARLRLR